MCGYGDVDTGCTFAVRGSGARVFTAVCDPICAVQARVESFQVAVIESVVLVDRHGDIVRWIFFVVVHGRRNDSWSEL